MSEPYERFSVSHVEYRAASKALDDSYRLRYEIYCSEEQFLPAQDYPDHLQFDNYDEVSEHFIVREAAMDKLAGCSRLIKYSKELGFPTADHFPELYSKLSGLPLEKVCEVSRFCVSSDFRQRLVPKDGPYGIESYLPENRIELPEGQAENRRYPIVLLLMIKAMYQLSLKRENRYWIASMEPGLIRYFSSCGMQWVRLANDYIDFYGKVMPCLVDLEKAINQMSEKRPDIHNFIISKDNIL